MFKRQFPAAGRWCGFMQDKGAFQSYTLEDHVLVLKGQNWNAELLSVFAAYLLGCW